MVKHQCLKCGENVTADTEDGYTVWRDDKSWATCPSDRKDTWHVPSGEHSEVCCWLTRCPSHSRAVR